MTTALQAEMIVAIAESEYTPINGGVPENLDEAGAVWTNVIVCDAIDKGVFTSLINAGLVDHSGSGRDSVCSLTETGFAEYQNIKATA